MICKHRYHSAKRMPRALYVLYSVMKICFTIFTYMTLYPEFVISSDNCYWTITSKTKTSCNEYYFHSIDNSLWQSNVLYSFLFTNTWSQSSPTPSLKRFSNFRFSVSGLLITAIAFIPIFFIFMRMPQKGCQMECCTLAVCLQLQTK